MYLLQGKFKTTQPGINTFKTPDLLDLIVRDKVKRQT